MRDGFASCNRINLDTPNRGVFLHALQASELWIGYGRMAQLPPCATTFEACHCF